MGVRSINVLSDITSGELGQPDVSSHERANGLIPLKGTITSKFLRDPYCRTRPSL